MYFWQVRLSPDVCLLLGKEKGKMNRYFKQIGNYRFVYVSLKFLFFKEVKRIAKKINI
jgi:hypothetical protein